MKCTQNKKNLGNKYKQWNKVILDFVSIVENDDFEMKHIQIKKNLENIYKQQNDNVILDFVSILEKKLLCW